jgi:curved DNA-binding protein
MKFTDYYDTLGLAPGADGPAIKAAYRRLARKHHPDLNPSSSAQQAMTQVNEAYEVLSDPAKRSAYDSVRSRRGAQAGTELPADWHEGFQFEGAPSTGRSGEAFSDFFSSLFGRSSRPEPKDAEPGRGRDEHVRVAIDLQDAFNGAQRSITVRSLAPDAGGQRVASERKLQVQIPKGVKEGQHIRLAGQGSAGHAGGAPGDLYLEVRFAPHPRYQTQGQDVLGRVAVAPWEAALGARIEAPTPAGPVQVEVPPNSPQGRKLRLKGRGLPGEPPGDFLLALDLVLPSSDDPKARALYEAMAREIDFDPRPARSAPKEAP